MEQSTKRFSVYHLEDGELYIKEFVGLFQFAATPGETVQILAKLHLSSRSITLEPPSPTEPLYKFVFSALEAKPQLLVSTGESKIKMTVSHFYEIEDNKFRVPFKRVKRVTDVFFLIKEGSTEKIYKQISDLIDRQENKENAFESDNLDFLSPFYSFEFDKNNLKSASETPIIKKELMVKMVEPLVETPGMLLLTDSRIYFEPLYCLLGKAFFSIKYYKLVKCKKRRQRFKENSLELATKKKTFFFSFSDENIRNTIYQKIYDLTGPECETNISIEKFTELWRQGTISNYEYLLKINDVAGRTKADLTQYPVFPWVIKDFDKFKLDLEDESIFRDLSKPIGALNQERLRGFKERFELMPEPKFLYGTHYSSPAYVIGYLFRDYPQFMLRLQVKF